MSEQHWPSSQEDSPFPREMDSETALEKDTASDKDIAPIECWRCGKAVDSTGRACPFCAANLRPDIVPAVPLPKTDPASNALVRMLVVFALMLAVSLVAGALRLFQNDSPPHRKLHGDAKALAVAFIFEGIDTALVVAALCLIRLPFRGFTRSRPQRLAAWLGFIPLLAVMLAFNLAYHEFLRQLLPFAPIRQFPPAQGLLLWLCVIATCVQPALVEEFFFRYLAIGVLRSVVGVHTSVWISATMFALAHIYNPLGLPVLFVLGVFLGYARVAGGRITLPIFLHFAHNAVVSYFNGSLF